MKYVYTFQEGNKDMRNLLGGKGANLAEMTNLGLPVPKGFTITTDACKKYYEENCQINEDMIKEITNHIQKLEQETQKTFGKGEKPLLLSIRSGSPISMPGMMDTVLNLGMNDEVAKTMINLTNNPRFVYDSYRRFIMMYSDVVKEIPRELFENKLEEYKRSKNITKDIELDAIDLQNLTEDYKKIYQENLNVDFPTDPETQVIEAVKAVFKSWNNERAIYYRKMNKISDDLGTAVNVQEMVFGNIGNNSGSGVAFTRNPSTGEKELYGEYLMNAQGEDVVAGIRTPLHMEELENEMPQLYQEFLGYAKRLEEHYHDMQDMEFTIENGKLFMLQTRNGKRTGAAALKIAVDLVEEGLISKEEAILKMEVKQIENVLHPTFDELEEKNASVIAKGLAASPGAAVGQICFSSKDVKKWTEENKKVILVRTETSPEDIEGMHHAEGILTVRGGMTSHAAVVARGMGVCCVSGCEEIWIDETNKTLHFPNDLILQEGDIISLNGSKGTVYQGKISLKSEIENPAMDKFLSWLDEIGAMKVRANADTESDAVLAKKMGALGIGLCRTEHMFFQKKEFSLLEK